MSTALLTLSLEEKYQALNLALRLQKMIRVQYPTEEELVTALEHNPEFSQFSVYQALYQIKNGDPNLTEQVLLEQVRERLQLSGTRKQHFPDYRAYQQHFGISGPDLKYAFQAFLGYKNPGHPSDIQFIPSTDWLALGQGYYWVAVNDIADTGTFGPQDPTLFVVVGDQKEAWEKGFIYPTDTTQEILTLKALGPINGTHLLNQGYTRAEPNKYASYGH